MIRNFPLLLIVLVVYNGLLFGMGVEGVQWNETIFSLGMVSGATWDMTLADLIITLGLFLLFFEILKATRVGSTSIIDHMISTLVLIIFLVEFLLVPGAATSVFFILMLMALVDVMAGFSVSIRAATRDVSLGDQL